MEDKQKEGKEDISMREQKHVCLCKIMASSMLDEKKLLNTGHNSIAGYSKVIAIINSGEQVLPTLMEASCWFKKREQFALEM